MASSSNTKCSHINYEVSTHAANPVHTAARFGDLQALEMMVDSNPDCLFFPDKGGKLAIDYAHDVSELETFIYLFNQMKSYKLQFYTLLREGYGLKLLSQAIDAGLIDVADELINDYPMIATQVQEKGAKTPLESIIRKPNLFYSGTHYSLWQRFVYHYVPTESNCFVSTHKADVENPETHKKDKFVTKYTRWFLHGVISRIWVKLWETILQVPHVKQLKDAKVKHETTIKLLNRICVEADRTYSLQYVEHLYSSPFCLAVENNNPEAIYVLATYFSRLYNSSKDGQDIYQLTVLNRSEKVYSYLLHLGHNTIIDLRLSRDGDGNNILHLAGRLAPEHKLNAVCGAALQMQRQIQWFEEVKKAVGSIHTDELNSNNETPMMVFTREHKTLRKDGEEWMKKTAKLYSIIATFILLISFVSFSAITVPGGNSTSGKPTFEKKAGLNIFANSVGTPLFTSAISMLSFRSLLTARYTHKDFLYKLPGSLIAGLVMLFVSVTSLMIACGAALYMMFGQGKAWILIPIVALACFAIASVVPLQLLVDLISSTYGGIFGKKKEYRKANRKRRRD